MRRSAGTLEITCGLLRVARAGFGRTFAYEMPRQKRSTRAEALPGGEDEEEDEADDQHGDHGGVGPAVLSGQGERTWKQEESEGGDDEEDAEHCSISSVDAASSHACG